MAECEESGEDEEGYSEVITCAKEEVEVDTEETPYDSWFEMEAEEERSIFC
jgi:hypothetical protein